MPTLPLYTPAEVPDASHRVVAPGGYETWHFDAESASGGLLLVATLGQGSPCDASYLREYRRYRRRPTRRPPPLPADHAFADVAVYENDRFLASFTSRLAPGEFDAGAQEPAVTAGANAFRREDDGSISLRLRGVPSATGNGQLGGDACLSAQLAFRPLRVPSDAFETSAAAAHASSDLHRWVIAEPLCAVEGAVVVTAGAGGASRSGVREIDFRGRGYHDHTYGTGPPGAAARRWARGRVLFGNHGYAFDVARPLTPRLPDAARLVRFDRDGISVVADEPLTVRWAERGMSPAYPAELTCGSRLRLVDPRVVDASPSRARVVYHASAHGGGETGRAFCEIGYGPGWVEWVRRRVTRVFPRD
jgi:hypothetical protein